MKKTIILLSFGVIIFAAGFIIGDISASLNPHATLESKEYNEPKIIIEKTNINKKYKAQILYIEKTKKYSLAIVGGKGTQVIVATEFIPSAAYHAPIIKLFWSSPSIVSITVDNDFGDNVKEYEFNISELSFSEKSSNK